MSTDIIDEKSWYLFKKYISTWMIYSSAEQTDETPQIKKQLLHISSIHSVFHSCNSSNPEMTSLKSNPSQLNWIELKSFPIS